MNKKRYGWILFLLALGIFMSFHEMLFAAENKQENKTGTMEKLHILIPGSPGGGWDSTARAVGQVLRKTNLAKIVSYENMSGAGGGRAMGYLIKTAKHQQKTWMVQSNPIVTHAIKGILPFSYKDLTPIARIIGDYAVLAVAVDSDFYSFNDILQAFRKDRRAVRIAGGSTLGDMDHLGVSLAFKAAGENPKSILYIPYDTGSKALAGLLSGEANVLATGFGEAIEQQRNGMLRIIAIASPERNPLAPNLLTYRELGYDVVFANWRGFFGPPGLPAEQADVYAAKLATMMKTDAWEKIRQRYGWTNFYLPRNDFLLFLEKQQITLQKIREGLGFQ